MPEYGCTAGCSATFTNREHWARHENTQHYGHEIWVCTEPVSGAPCLRWFYNYDLYAQHLLEDHEIDLSENLEYDIDSHRIPSNFQGRFWCGFCREIVDLQARDPIPCWLERHNHIANHFNGQGGPIYYYADWYFIGNRDS